MLVISLLLSLLAFAMFSFNLLDLAMVLFFAAAITFFAGVYFILYSSGDDIL